jgi:hypothetical protein
MMTTLPKVLFELSRGAAVLYCVRRQKDKLVERRMKIAKGRVAEGSRKVGI